MMNDITTFRTILPDDLPKIISLYNTYRPTGLSKQRMEKELEKHPNILAVNNLKIIGFAYCYGFAPDIVELANIFVEKQFRGKGLGKKMLELVCKKSSKKYCGIIAVNSLKHETFEEKIRPNNLYIRSGFNVVFETPSSTIFAKSI